MRSLVRTEIYEKRRRICSRYFSVIGLSERFEESLALMKLRFGWKLQRYSSFNVSSSARGKPMFLNRLSI